MFTKKLPINIIESDQSYNIYRTNIDGKTKVNHIRYQQLVCSTIPRLNIRLDGDKLIVKISCYDKYGLAFNGYSNFFMELKCVIRFINRTKYYTTSLFFTTLQENCVSKDYYDIKEYDKLEMNNELQIKLLEFMNNVTNK